MNFEMNESSVHSLCDINGINIQLQCKTVHYSKINVIIDNSKGALIPNFEWIEQVFGLAPLLFSPPNVVYTYSSKYMF